MKKEQWKEKFSDAMNDLQDEYVQESAAEESQKTAAHKRKKTVAGLMLGLAAAAAVVIGLLFGTDVIRREKARETVPAFTQAENPASEAAREETEIPVVTVSSPESAVPVVCLVSPEYPETVQIASAEDCSNQGLSEKVWEEERARREYAKALEGSGTEFYRETISRMVGDSESVNPLCSPANLYLSLALLSECGSGETRAQILSALGLPDQGSAAKNAQNLVLANYVDNGLIKSHFSDSLWLNSGMYYRENTLERLRDQYFASVFQGTMGDPAYDQALQDWVNAETGRFLRNQVSGLEMDPSGALELLSTLYLRAMWTTPFSPDRTQDGVFHGTHGDAAASFMHSDEDRSYYYAEHFGAISLSLGNEMNMWLLLPDEGVDVRALASDEEAMDLLLSANREREEHWDEKRAYVTVHLALPKFDISADNELKPTMQAMGITDAFLMDQADFSALCQSEDPVWLSDARNGIRIAIDEEGLTAASYIDMMLAGAAPVTDEVDFSLDRPFMYCITGNGGAPLFAGIVEQF